MPHAHAQGVLPRHGGAWQQVLIFVFSSLENLSKTYRARVTGGGDKRWAVRRGEAGLRPWQEGDLSVSPAGGGPGWGESLKGLRHLQVEPVPTWGHSYESLTCGGQVLTPVGSGSGLL